MVLGIIPARANSKGIPRKNLYPLNGRPLIDYTIDAAFKSKLDDFVISTDDKEIALMWKSIIRPPELAQDDTPMLPVIQHAVKRYEKKHKSAPVEAVMTLQPTSPLRLAEDINEALRMFKAGDRDSLVSVYWGIHPVKSYPVEEGCSPKPFLPQEPYDKHKHKCLTRNGAIFITRRDLLDSGRLIGDDPLFYIMPKARSIDVDDFDDLMIAEAILRRGEIH